MCHKADIKDTLITLLGQFVLFAVVFAVMAVIYSIGELIYWLYEML